MGAVLDDFPELGVILQLLKDNHYPKEFRDKIADVFADRERQQSESLEVYDKCRKDPKRIAWVTEYLNRMLNQILTAIALLHDLRHASPFEYAELYCVLPSGTMASLEFELEHLRDRLRQIANEVKEINA